MIGNDIHVLFIWFTYIPLDDIAIAEAISQIEKEIQEEQSFNPAFINIREIDETFKDIKLKKKTNDVDIEPTKCSPEGK